MILYSDREPEARPIDWSSPRWGQAGANVHVAANGSHVIDRHGKDS